MGILLIFIFIIDIEGPVCFACNFFRQLDHHFGGGFHIFFHFIIKLPMMLSIGKEKIHIVEKWRARTTIQHMQYASNHVYLMHSSPCWISFRALCLNDTIFVSWTIRESLTMEMIDSNVALDWLIEIEFDDGCVDVFVVLEM